MKMTDAFEYDVQGFLDRLAQSAVEMRQTSEHMLTTANHASACAARVTTVAGQATTSVQSVAAATEQLSSRYQRSVARSCNRPILPLKRFRKPIGPI